MSQLTKLNSLNLLKHFSEYGEKDQFLAFTGTGGILNLDKIQAAQTVLEQIALYQDGEQSSKSTDAFSCSSYNSRSIFFVLITNDFFENYVKIYAIDDEISFSILNL